MFFCGARHTSWSIATLSKALFDIYANGDRRSHLHPCIGDVYWFTKATKKRRKDIELFVNSALLIALSFVTVSILRARLLIEVIILSSVYSALLTVIFVSLDALDVAMTEASVGVGVSTILLLSAWKLVGNNEETVTKISYLSLGLSIGISLLLVFSIAGLPTLGEPDTPIHLHLSTYFLENTLSETGIINTVTAILASYRGFDTMGEVVVIFTAGVGVLSLLKRENSDEQS